MKRLITILGALALTFAGAGAATADTNDPTVGDTITYAFYSDSQVNASITYFDADSQLQTIENAKLSTYDRTEGWYYGSITFTSRSTYQLVAASIQTNGKLAGCATRINGESSGLKTATGQYTVATCPE
ncbi:hypothetical protein GOPIP_079_00230 [Gordonia polyisoprenivorans NBRC 16320 = JCM 10675]|uniref:Secreted protein n=1 Tax=Gordonia polyisoprenivorans TaxID=84595 RepID=A0A846WTF1_9ACTN|nr:hypothetical protein [Gordonia polyisoprenivorans]NKY04988.1 hypothetical protein [Gordonia polyisoprenivorans]QUD82561.1 hypothetical protein J8M97_23195 [Gordonia polyisoprenivorans]GAB25334.1 hypothetical protein GOPIP_079_00230 [Gordonia polyisoprenivorans NBRC 16320 = JCM 10675]